MKTTLNQTFVLRLSINQKPEIVDGKIVYRPNDGKPYYVFDNHQQAPIGFGVKVQKTKKVYIIQRKVNGSLIKSNVGNVSDFAKIDFARDAARGMVEIIKKTRRNPNAIQKQIDLAELTVKQAFDNYKTHLAGRQPPVKPNSLKALNKAINKLDKWSDRRKRWSRLIGQNLPCFK